MNQILSSTKEPPFKNKKIDVVHFHRKPFPGQFSIESLFENLRGALLELGHDVRHAELPCYSKGIWLRIRNVLWARNNQTSINHITGDVHFIAIGLCAKRTILTIHDLEMLSRNRGFKRWILKFFWFDFPVRNVAIITVISKATRNELIKYCPAAEKKTVVIPNSVDPLFKPSCTTFRSEKPTILQIGTKPNKNIARVAEALSQIPCHLVIVGHLPSRTRQTLEKYQVSYEVKQKLSKNDLIEEYKRCDVVSFVSTYEGFGMPIIEAQSIERPVVTSGVSSMPEVAGCGACFVDPFDIDSIRTGFLRVINDVEFRNQIIENGRKNRARFSRKHVVNQYLDVYHQILNARGVKTIMEKST